MGYGNTLAFATLAFWPLISFLFYKRLDALSATFCTLLWGFLLLPVKTEFDFPLIPPLDKESISTLCAFVFLRVFKKTRIPLTPKPLLDKALVLIIIFIPFVTILNNTESILWLDGTSKPGLTIYDGFSSAFSNVVELLPFLIGYQIVRSYDDQVQIFRLLILAGLVYAIPIFIEIRLSPQLHTWIYGFFPHQFAQQMRSGGFRPVVFLGHGLLVSMFMAVVIGCLLSFWKAKIKAVSLPIGTVTGSMFVLLVFSKGLGAVIYTIVLGLLIQFSGIRLIGKLSIAFATVLLLYPLLITQDLFPHNYLIELSRSVDVERAQSLEFRFDQESALVKHALEKPYFGWGSWGRNMIENSITDGYWIIMFGRYGIIGFTAIALLLWLTIWRCNRVMGLLSDRKEQIIFSGHTLIASIILLDQIPNDSMHMISWFLLGALGGRCLGIARSHKLSMQVKMEEAFEQEKVHHPGLNSNPGRVTRR